MLRIVRIISISLVMTGLHAATPLPATQQESFVVEVLRGPDHDIDEVVKRALQRLRGYASIIRYAGYVTAWAGDGILRKVSDIQGVASDKTWQNNTIGLLLLSGHTEAALRTILGEDPTLIDALLRGAVWGTVFCKTTVQSGYITNLIFGVLASLVYLLESKAINAIVRKFFPAEKLGGASDPATMERCGVRLAGYALMHLINAAGIFAASKIGSAQDGQSSTTDDIVDVLSYFLILPTAYQLFVESTGIFIYENVYELMASADEKQSKELECL